MSEPYRLGGAQRRRLVFGPDLPALLEQGLADVAANGRGDERLHLRPEFPMAPLELLVADHPLEPGLLDGAEATAARGLAAGDDVRRAVDVALAQPADHDRDPVHPLELRGAVLHSNEPSLEVAFANRAPYPA